ncbi:hypothetical protein HOLleu_28791 [Holothuria leucospilota]|uniref:Uncharacterized protein n=1 Tax=Holothuria leucospilota TaxID=206669 RepID=A0A9Q1BMS1_HOLLE|nr:hypothetical protein HOLleu_28791 [Holothuria leucospilota]
MEAAAPTAKDRDDLKQLRDRDLRDQFVRGARETWVRREFGPIDLASEGKAFEEMRRLDLASEGKAFEDMRRIDLALEGKAF